MVRTGRGKIFCCGVRLFFDKFFGVVGIFMKKGAKVLTNTTNLGPRYVNEEI